MNVQEFDYLIVGQGIAGTCLAWHLLQKNKRVLILNDSNAPSATLVAAGIFNPLTGRKLVKTWMADELFPYAIEFYSHLEKQLRVKLIYPESIYRPYRSDEERKNYLNYASEPDVSKYIVNGYSDQLQLKGINNPWGGLEVTQSGWVDLKALVQKSKKYFIENNQYIEGKLDHTDLIINDYEVVWKDFEIKKILFCQGFDARENPLFNWLPFNPVKGQILDVTFDEYSANCIVNQGIFIMPLPDTGLYRVGATYSWHDLDWKISEDGRNYLESRLKPLIEGSYEIQTQKAGIRPSSKDRRPFVGLHPTYRSVGIFNGLGTKGVTLAPFFAAEFADHLIHGKELNPLVNIDRYFSLYYH